MHFSKYMCNRDRLSDLHQTAVRNIQEKIVKKILPRVTNHLINNETFRVSLINKLSNEVFVNHDDGLE